MPQPFRFGVQLHKLPPDEWIERVRMIEELGFSTVFLPDHFDPQWDPMTALAAIGAVTSRLHVGSLVYDVDYRHPVIYAKAAATTHILTGGRHEFGLGAGWLASDYTVAGIPYDPPAVRVQRLEEALAIITSMWTNETTSFDGRHYHVKDVQQAAPLAAGEKPKVLVGGGGRKVLSIAGRYADIVGINPSLHEGKVTPQTALDHVPARVREKVGWARAAAEAAGRDAAALEFQALVFVTAITDDPGPVRDGIAQATGMDPADVADCPMFLTGPGPEVCESLLRRRDETGINYVVVQGDDPATLASVADAIVRPLAGR